MKKLQRRQQQTNVNEMNEKKSKKKPKSDGLASNYLFDDEEENMGETRTDAVRIH
jgi:hypothetical protein